MEVPSLESSASAAEELWKDGLSLHPSYWASKAIYFKKSLERVSMDIKYSVLNQGWLLEYSMLGAIRGS